MCLAPATARALAVYLRARRAHKLADSDWVWLGTRNRGRLRNTGIRKMLVRRAAEAGYARVTPHQFRTLSLLNDRVAISSGAPCEL